MNIHYSAPDWAWDKLEEVYWSGKEFKYRMKFIKKHPYLFWQCIGFFILAVDCLYVWFNLENEQVSYAFIVLSAMLAFAIITLSPFVIKCRKKMKDPAEIEESYRYKYIEEWYNIHIYGSAKGVAVIITMIVLFIGGTCVLTYFGLPFLAFLLFYVDVWIYSLWKNHVKRTFYKVPDGAKRCELIYVNDIAFLDLLDSQTALCYFSKPSDEMLDFLYNRFYSETLNQKRLLMNEHLKIYVVNGRVFNEKYGTSEYDLPMSDEECLLCILPDELNPEVMSCKEVALRDYGIGGCLFSEYVENCPELM